MIKPLEEITDYCREIRTALRIARINHYDVRTVDSCQGYIVEYLELIWSDVQHIDEYITKLESKP
jgi:hypothetical protein